MKKVATLALVVLFMLLGAQGVLAQSGIPAPTRSFYVNDFADVLSAAEETTLMNNAVLLGEKDSDGIQVVITTVKSLGGMSVEDFASEMYKQYAIGRKSMGVLILMSMEERDYKIETGDEIESYITDSICNRLVEDYALAYWGDNIYGKGFINLQAALINEIKNRVPAKYLLKNAALATSAPVAPKEERVTPKEESAANTETKYSLNGVFTILTSLLLVAVIFLLWFLLKKNKENKRMAKQIDDFPNKISRVEASFEEERSESAKAYDVITTHKNQILEQLSNLQGQYSDLQERNSALQDFYNRILLLHPDAEKEVKCMIAEELRQKDIATAAEVEAIISKVLSLEPDKEIVQELQSALSSYDSLTDTQKGFVKSDINLLKRLLDQSLELKNKYEEELKIQHDKEAAADAEREISDVISYVSSGTRENLDRLENAKREYDRLSYDERQYFDDSLISRLSSLISQAEDDKEAYDRHKREEEEAKAEEARKDRERRAMLNSSMHHDSDFGSIGSHSSGLGGMGSHSPSSFGGSHSTPTHTGFGGKSSGGGTKGKF